MKRQKIQTIKRCHLTALVCQDSFYEFVQRFWHTVVPQKPVWNWHIKLFCDELQEVAERVFAGAKWEYDLIVNVPPRSTKSTVFSVMFPAWVWTRMPEAGTIAVSYALSLAHSLSRKCRNIIVSPQYREYFPEVKLNKDQNSKTEFTTTVGGMRYAAGIGGGITGRHAHFLIVDDPINPLEAMSMVTLQRAIDWLSETLPSRKIDQDLTPTILIMQRLHQMDPTGYWLEHDSEHAKHICLPADISHGAKVVPPELAKKYTDDLLDPRQLSRGTLDRLEKRLGPYGYAGQYDQSPIPRSGGMFHVDQLIVGEPNGIIRKARFWDRAASAGKGDWTVGVLMGIDSNGTYWVLDVVRGQWDTAQRERIIAQTAVMDGHDTIIGIEQEPGSSGKDAIAFSIKALAGYSVHPERPSGSKEIRADAYSIQVNSGNVRLSRAAWNKAYLEELTYFPASKHDDQVDASSGAFRMVSQGNAEVSISSYDW